MQTIYTDIGICQIRLRSRGGASRARPGRMADRRADRPDRARARRLGDPHGLDRERPRAARRDEHRRDAPRRSRACRRAEYEAASYYERWLFTTETILAEKGVLASGRARREGRRMTYRSGDSVRVAERRARRPPPDARLSQGQARHGCAGALDVHEPRDARLRRRRAATLSVSTSSSSSAAKSSPWDATTRIGCYADLFEHWLEPRRERPRHDHDHAHDPIGRDGEPPAAARVRALEELLVEKGVLTREEVRARIDWLVSRTPAHGARLVARAWVDPSLQGAPARRRACGRARARPRPGPVAAGRRAREHRERASHGRLHALLLLPEGAPRPAARLVQEPALPLTSGLRSAGRPREFGLDARERRRAPRRGLDGGHPLPRRSADARPERSRWTRTRSPRSSRETR